MAPKGQTLTQNILKTKQAAELFAAFAQQGEQINQRRNKPLEISGFIGGRGLVAAVSYSIATR